MSTSSSEYLATLILHCYLTTTWDKVAGTFLVSTAATSSTPKSAVYVLLSRIAYELQEVFSTKIKISVLETGLGLRQLPGQPKFSYSQLHVILNSLPSHVVLITSC